MAPIILTRWHQSFSGHSVFDKQVNRVVCMFLSINAFLGDRLVLAASATAGFVVLGGIVMLFLIRLLSGNESQSTNDSPTATESILTVQHRNCSDNEYAYPIRRTMCRL